MKLINYIWVLSDKQLLSFKLKTYVYDKLSQSNINESKLVDTLCWIYFCKMTTYNNVKLNKFVNNE